MRLFLFIVVYLSEAVDGCCADAGFCEDEEGSVGYDFEDHVAGVVVYGCI